MLRKVGRKCPYAQVSFSRYELSICHRPIFADFIVYIIRLIAIRVNPYKATPYSQIECEKLKELVNLNNLCNFQLFAGNNKGNSSDRKLRNFSGGKNVNGTYILCKVLSFSKIIFSVYRAQIFTDN